MGRSGAARFVGGACAAALLCAAPAGAAVRTIEAESLPLDPAANPGVVVKPTSLVLSGKAVLKTQITLRDTTRFAARIGARQCSRRPALDVTIDGRHVLVASAPLKGWQTVSGATKIGAGVHALTARVLAPRNAPACAHTLGIDWFQSEEKVAVTTAVIWGQTNNAQYRSTLLSNFSGITPENEMKWQFVEPQQGRFDFTTPDEMVQFAGDNGKQFHGHTLVYGSQLPSWLADRNKVWKKGEVEGIMRNYIQTVVSRYKGRVASWDVVNEPLGPDGSLANNVFLKEIGANYLQIAFTVAHEADPNAKLFLNEGGAEVMGPKSNGLFELVRRMRDSHIPIDGVGFQSHTAIGSGSLTADAVRPNFKRFADLGVQLAVSEIDVRTSTAAGLTDDQRLDAQAAVYREMATACLAQPACTRYTTWDFYDPVSWLGRTERALPFDAAFQPKPAWKAIMSVLGSVRR